MNKLFYTFLLFCISNISFAQSFSWIADDTMTTTLVGDGYAVMKMEQKNETGDTLNLAIEVLSNELSGDWDGMVCVYGMCLGMLPDAGVTAKMNPVYGSDNGYVRLTIGGNNTVASGSMRIKVYDVDSPAMADTGTWIVSSIKDTSETSIKELNEKSLVNVFPNPSNGFINVSSQSIGVEEVSIFNIIGQQIEKFTLSAFDSKRIELNKGVYFVVVSTENRQSYTEQVVIYE